MRAALREYLGLLARLWWQVFIGVGCGVIGAGKDMGVINWPIPSWVWWGLAFAAFALAQFWAFRIAHQELTKYRHKPKADTSLLSLQDYVYKRLVIDDNLADPLQASENAIVERALAGDLQFFGTRTSPDDGDGIMEAIDREYWRSHSLTFSSMFTFKMSVRDKTRWFKSSGDGEIFFNLHTDLNQVYLCWPQQTRIKWRWPLGRETF